MKRLLASVAAAALCLSTLAEARQYTNPDGSVSNGFVPEIGGSPVGPNNPMPVSGAVGGGGGGGGSSGPVYGPNATGTSPSFPPLFIAGIDANGKILPFTITASGLQVFDQAAELALGAPADTAATVGGNGSVIAQLKQTVTQLASVVNSLTATAGQPVQVRAGTAAIGSIGNAGFNAMQGGAANSSSNPFFTQDSEPDGANVTLGSKADTANAAIGSTAMAIFRQLHADAIAATPAGPNVIGKVGIDQTTPGTTNKVTLGPDTVTVVDAALEAAAGAQADAAAAITGGTAGNGSQIAQLKAAVSQLAAVLANQPDRVISNTTTVGAASGGNLAMGSYNAAPAVTASKPFPIQLDIAGSTRQTAQASLGVGGIALYSRIPSSAASVNQTAAKTTAGRVYKIVACNTSTTSYRIKFWNALTANVTPGTTAPLLSRPIPAAAATGGLNCAAYDASDIGWYFSTAITYAIVAGAADNDATAPTAGAVTDVSVEYQ